MQVVWFILFLIFIIIEICTINLVSIWFAIGALVALIVSIFTNNIIIEVIIFIISSIISLFTTKRLLSKFKINSFEPTNLDRVIEKTGKVTKTINKDEYGQVKVLGSTWTAIAKEKLEIGEKIRVKEIEGVKLIVEKEN